MWVGGTADTGLHERAPYWLNGIVPLARLMRNMNRTGATPSPLKAQVDKYLDHILSSQHPSGWLGEAR